MTTTEFQHRHAGHCESGAIASLLSHNGLPISEPMAFGLSGSLLFTHLPFVRMGGVPLTAYRMLPGSVINGLAKQIGFKVHRERFRDPAQAEAALDRYLDAGKPVGLQSSVYWLPYFPPDMRFHFNAHNLVVYGKEAGEYLISDPVFESPQVCAGKDLRKARFARGPFAPKGLIYYPQNVPSEFDLPKALRKTLKRTVNVNLRTPLPIVGVRAIRMLARKLEQLPARESDPRKRRLFVSSIIRMQEEIGTGGGGFRFIFASFLQEAGDRLDHDGLRGLAEQMTACGDRWRDFALAGAKICKNDTGAPAYKELGALLADCARLEEAAYREMKGVTV